MDGLNRRKKIRKAILKKIIEIVESGEFDNVKETLDQIYPLSHEKIERFIPRGEYKSPLERDTHNYGYTELFELEGLNSPNVW